MTEGEEKPDEETQPDDQPTMVVESTRFGDLTVPEDSVIALPSGLIGFPRAQNFIMLDHKPPFSWLQSTDDPNLAFVVVDGFEFGDNYQIHPPLGDKDTDLQEEDEFAILVIVTVRPDPKDTTANLKAPVFVNLRNRRGVQIIFDNPNLSTRYPLWTEENENQQEQKEGEETDSAAEESTEE